MTACTRNKLSIPGLVAGNLAILLASTLIAACASNPSTTEPVKPTAAKGAPPAAAGSPAVSPEEAMAAADKSFKQGLDSLKQKKYPDAKATFGELAKQYPTMSGPLTDLGIVNVDQKKPEDALVAFQQAVAANPKNAVAYNWLGILYREKSAFSQSEQAYLKALAIDPKYANAHYNLAVLYDAYLHKPKEALDQYRIYVQISGSKDTKLTVWMKGLEAQTQVASSGAKP